MSSERNSEREGILRVFVQEASERLEELDTLVLELEEAPSSSELLNAFMRGAHTVKGSAGVAGLPDFSELAHVIESVVQKMREGHLSGSPELFDHLARSLDVLLVNLPLIAQGGDEPAIITQQHDDLEAWLVSIGEGEVDYSEGASEDKDFVLGEYDYIRIGVMRKQSKVLYNLSFRFEDDSENRTPWVLDVQKRLRKVGTVLSTQPQISDSEALAEAKQFLVLIASAHEEEQILEIVKEQLDLVPRIKVWDSDPQKEPGAEQKPEQITRAMVSEHSVRVELEVLNSLLRLVGELMISRDRFEVVSKEISEILGDPLMGAETLETAEQLGRLSSNLQDAVMQARMVPVTRVFRTVKRHIRREGRELGISIPFETEGETTELDKNLVDVLTDPIAEFAKSLFRFDTDHVLASKGMFFWAERRWNQIVLGLRTPVRSDDAAMSLLHNAVNGLGGRLEVRERDDDVFDYVLFLPLTLAIIRVMMTRVGDEVYAFPIENLQETLQLESDEITHVKGSRVIALRGEVLSLLFLKEYFDVLSTANEDEPHVLVLADDNSKIGVVVDGLLGIREVVIKPMNSRFSATKTITGSAILGDEHIALILSSDALIRSAIDEANAGSFRPEFKAN